MKLKYLPIGAVLVFIALFPVSCLDDGDDLEPAGHSAGPSATADSPSEPVFQTLKAEDFAKMYLGQGDNTILLDVRTPQEVAEGSLKNALNIDYYGSDFKSELAKLDKTKAVFIYCRSGNRSGNTLMLMKNLGFQKVYDLRGGFATVINLLPLSE